MAKLIVTGGKKLNGTIVISPNKNAVLPVLCATLLTEEECILHNVPKSPDVLKILEAMHQLGGTHHWVGTTLTVCCKNITSSAVSACVADIQSAILFVGPLLARFGYANVPVAVGCKLGYRGPEDHIYYLEQLGVTCTFKTPQEPGDVPRIQFGVDRSKLVSHDLVQFSSETTKKTFIFSEASVTPTENLLMLLSTVTKFDVEVQGIAHEPHVEYLVKVLRMMGVTIEGKGSVLTVKGSFGKIKGFECDFQEEPDHVDFYGTAVTAVLTRSNLFLKCLPTVAIHSMVEFLEKTGIRCRMHPDGVFVFGGECFFNPVEGFSKANDTAWKLNPRPWPGFPVDCLPSFIALASTSRHTTTSTVVNNWMYEDGLGYVPQLNQLGASIELFPTEFGVQKICITGSEESVEEYFVREHAQEITIGGVPVIEGTRALFSVALGRTGTTTIADIGPLLRRSPDFVQKFIEIGADIQLID